MLSFFSNRLFLLLLQSLILCSVIHAQWQWQNPLPQGNTLYSVTFVNQQTAWAGASGGTLVKTTDAGSTWQVVTLPERIFADALFFVDEEYGWTGGQGYNGSASLFATTNAGATWAIQLADSFGDFRAISFVNRRQGWATGQHSRIYHTSNGGRDWNLQAYYLGLQFIYSLSFIDSLNGWGAAKELLHTTNGGLNWIRDSTILWSRDIVFVDSLRGWVCGQEKIARTTDGGRTWQVMYDLGPLWTDMSVVDFDNVMVLSQSRSIAYTSNGGVSWTTQNNVSTTSLNDIAFSGTMNGLVVGGNGLILKSSDGGASWQNMLQTTTSNNLSGMHFLDSQRGWIAGSNGTILKTTNGGSLWNRLTTGVSSGLGDIFFTNSSLGWTVGGNGTILRTTNGGDTWTQQNSPINRGWAGIEFKHYPSGWIVGGDGTDSRLLQTTNGGLIWNEVTSIALQRGASEIQFTSANVGWIMVGSGIVGSIQSVYKTTDGGVSWSQRLTGNSDTSFYSMSFVSDSNGWISTLGYVMYHTSNGGTTWQALITPGIFQSICFLTNTEGWAGGLSGIHHTTDAGATWQEQSSPLGSFINELMFIDPQHGWVIGNSGNIIATTNGGSTGITEREQVATDRTNIFALYQNYPNPFNPKTTIRFNLLAPSKTIQLNIYDILGRVIKTIEIRDPPLGSNEVSWDGKNNFGKEVASGVYILNMNSNGTIQSGKMLLIR